MELRTMVRCTILLAVLAFPMIAWPEGDEKIEGKWVIVSTIRDGKEDESMKDAIREHKGSKYLMSTKNGKSFEGAMKVDAKAKTIDITPSGGTYKDKTLLGIYEVEGETLKIAFAEPGKERPKEFASKPGSGVVLAVHKKAK
jgi:uncharacterized protein (TIGR03067 family)